MWALRGREPERFGDCPVPEEFDEIPNMGEGGSMRTKVSTRLRKAQSLFTWLRLSGTALIMAVAVTALLNPGMAGAASKAEIDRDVTASLKTLLDSDPDAKLLAEKAAGILVFPSIVKGGFIVGAMYGEGALRVKGRTAGYYNAVAASYGLQAGVQTFGYAVFFMSQEKLKYLDESEGWEIGGAPSLVVVNKGAARSLSTTSARDEIYVFFYDQSGLMGGLGLQGTKISKIDP
jgi:lipid-binding SYLF domain-containing protein